MPLKHFHLGEIRKVCLVYRFTNLGGETRRRLPSGNKRATFAEISTDLGLHWATLARTGFIEIIRSIPIA